MKFCSQCGHAVIQKIPSGDNRLRVCCENCEAIHYENPRMVVGTVPVFGDKVLLCKRAIEPRYGYWTLPAGFMENGESIAQGAARETLEEAGAQAEIGALFSVLDVPHVHQVHIFYLASLTSSDLDPGEESLEAKFFAEEEIPWDQLAFPTIRNTLRWYFEDRQAGRLPVVSAENLDANVVGATHLGTNELRLMTAFTPHQKVLVPPTKK